MKGLKIHSGVALVLVVIVMACGMVMAATATWDPKDGFSPTYNPNDPWVYGYRQVVQSSDLTTYIYHHYFNGSTWEIAPGDYDAIQMWHRTPTSWDGATKWLTDNPWGIFPPVVAGDVSISGIGPSLVGVCRFVTPSAGTYNVGMTFIQPDSRQSGFNQHAYVVVNGTTVGSGLITGWGDSYAFSPTNYSLSAGNTIEFVTDGSMSLLLRGAITGPTGAEFWLAAAGDPTGTPITSVDVAPGETFAVSLWYQTGDTWPHNALEVLVGYDRSVDVGTGASALDGKIVPAGGVSNINAAFPVVLANNVGGGYSTTGTPHPYGAHLSLGRTLKTTGAAGNATRICDITLKNQAIAAGEYYDMTIWNGGEPGAMYWATYAAMRSNLRYDATPVTLRVNSPGAAVVTSINQVKTAADATPVTLSGAIVAAKFVDGSWPISFSIEDPLRSSGVRVVWTSAVNVGDGVNIQGTVGTVDGERVINAASVGVVSTGNAVPEPLAMAGKKSAGGAYGFQGAVVDTAPGTLSTGTNSVGLLVKVWGKVTARHETGDYSGYFYVNDGSGITDGSGNVGIKCRASGYGITPDALPALNSSVQVTGVMGVQKISGINARYVWSSSWAPVAP